MDFIISPFKLLFRNRDLIYRSVLDEIQKRNAGSVLGNAWLILAPIIMLGLYSVVYLFIFQMRPTNMDRWTYIIQIFCGLLPFLINAEAWSLSLSSISKEKTLLQNTIFPLEILPIKSILSSTPTFGVGMLILMFMDSFLSSGSLLNLLVVPIFLLHILFLIGIAWIFSIVSLFFQDLKNIIIYVNMCIMIMSPIAYSLDAVPPAFRSIIWLNPVAYFILSYQAVVANNTMPDLFLWAGMTILALGPLILGYRFFVKTKRIAASYV